MMIMMMMTTMTKRTRKSKVKKKTKAMMFVFSFWMLTQKATEITLKLSTTVIVTRIQKRNCINKPLIKDQHHQNRC